MQPSDLTALLEAVPEQHSRRCAQAQNAIDSQRWFAAAFHLRTAATSAQEWADRAATLAEWCDAQAANSAAGSSIGHLAPDAEPPTLAMPRDTATPPTTEAIEAGLMALAHAMGPDHATRVHRAMNEVLAAEATREGGVPCA
jgi:uncharacterized protein (DUF885 family)